MHHVTSSSKRKKEVRLAPDEEPEFQIAPMIDILLVLLVFFMSISSTEVLQVNRDIILAVAKDAKDKPKNLPGGQAIINVLWVDMSRSGMIELDEKKYPDAPTLATELRKRILKQPAMRVLLRADRRAEWSFIREIMRACGDAGVTNVTFSVVDKEVPK